MATLETWNGRTASQTDADSPQDTTLWDGVRKDLDHLRQVLYGNNEGAGTYYTPAWGHNHDGTNSEPVILSSVSAGDYIIHLNADERTTTSASYALLKESKIGVGGTFRIKFSAKGVDGADAFRIYRNGSAVGTARNPGASYVEYSEDISGWATGDLVQVYGLASGGDNTVWARDLKLCVASPHIAGATSNY